MLLPLIFTAQVGAAATSETGTRIEPFKPFWGSRTFVARHAPRTRRFVTTDAYVAQIMTSERAALNAQLQMRAMPVIAGESDDLLRLRLLAFLAELELPDDPLMQAGVGELRAMCAERGLDSQAQPDQLRAMLKLDPARMAMLGEPVKTKKGKTSEPTNPADKVVQPADLPTTTDAPQADPSKDDLDALRKAVAADDYRAVYTLVKDITGESPESKAKPVVFELAQKLLGGE